VTAHRVRLTPRLLADAQAQEDLLRAIREQERALDAALFEVFYRLRRWAETVPPERPPWWEGP
jgi:hypothetical protein